LLEENKDKLSESDRSALSAAIAKVNEAKKGEDAAALNQAIDELQRASQAMAEHLYAAGSAQPGGAGAGPGGFGPGGPSPDGGNAGPGGKPEDVIDVEFEEKK